MFKKGMALLLSILLVLSITGTAWAVEADGSFVFTAMNANSTIVEPVRIQYKAGQTILEALADSDIEFVGLEQGFIYEIAGVAANFYLYYDNGGYDLDALASDITVLCFHVSGSYSEAATILIKRMAEYREMENNVQNYPGATSAYQAALKGLRSADAATAQQLLDDLNAAIKEYEDLLNGVKYTVRAVAEQNGTELESPTITLTDAYGNQTTGTGSVQVIAGSYTFCISDGGYNRTEGSVTVSEDTSVSVSLPYGQWFGDIRLLDRSKEPYRYTQNDETHLAQYWVEDTADIVSSIYLNAAIGDVPDEANTKLRTIYVGTNGVDRSGTSRSWNSTATALIYLVVPGMEGRTFSLEAQYPDANGYTQIQSYTMKITRVPTLSSLTATAEGTVLPLSFSATTHTYDLTTVSSALDIEATAFGSDYTVTGAGTIQITGDSVAHDVVVTAPNGQSNTYTLNIRKVASVPVTLTVPTGTTAQVINGAGSVIAPVDGTYHLIPGEAYTCLATKDIWYHTEKTFTASSGLNVTVTAPITTDWLSDVALYNGTNASSRLPYSSDSDFTASNHSYKYTVSDCNSSLGIQATASTGTVTARYISQDKLVSNHNVDMAVTVSYAVSEKGLAKSLTNVIEKSGYGNTLTIRVSKEENGVTYYQDYTMKLLKQLHLTSLEIATVEETLPFMTSAGASCSYDRDVTGYYVRVNRETTELFVTGAYPNVSGDTDCCGGYYAKVNGIRCDELSEISVLLNTDSYNETITVQVCHADDSSIVTTYEIHVQKTDPINLTVTTTPADTVIFLTNNLNGKRIYGKNGVYSLTPGGSYSYTATCAGYIGQQVTDYTAPETDGNLTITLEKAPVNTTLKNFASAWPHLRLDNNNNGVVDYKTPVYAENTQLYWATQIGEGFDSNACGCPIIVNGYLYTYSGSMLYKVDTISGEILATAPMDHSSNFAINPPTYAEGMIFVGLANGTVQAFNADTLESLWIYKDALGGQPNCSIVYHDGYVYTGFWVGETSMANYVCLNASDEDPTRTDEAKLPTWYYTSKGGFYWAGAYVCDDYLLIGTDDGASGYTTGNPSLLSFDPQTGELLDQYKMSVTGDIRSSITCYNGKYYFTSKGGYLFEASVEKDGDITAVKTLKLYNYADDASNPAMSTCTPTIYNGRAYIGISGTAQFGAYSGHNITVIDIPNWEIAYTVRTHGYPQTSGVLTTAYEADTGCVYVYFFDNFTPGKLRVLEDKPGQTSVSLKTVETYNDAGTSKTYETPYNLFTPSGDQAQYAICSPIMDEYGTIYFKNDSAYLMAVGNTIERIEITQMPDKLNYAVGETFDATGMKVTAYYANGMSRDVTKYVTWSDAKLTADDTDFQITFPYVMYQNQENGNAMEYGVECLEPVATLTLTIGDSVMYGDINGDGIIDSTDAALVYRYAKGKYNLTETQFTAADVNGNGAVDSTDAALIYRKGTGKLTQFPVEANS